MYMYGRRLLAARRAVVRGRMSLALPERDAL